MAALFRFAQFEYPWSLGPADGRYLVRRSVDAEPQHVVVLATLGAERRHLLRRSRRRVRAAPDPAAAAVAVARATVIAATPANDEAEARAWLARAGEEQAQSALDVLDRVVYAQRIATADPFVNEPSIHQALVVRVGLGEGEQVAEGRWRDARELPVQVARRSRRKAVLRPQERLALLLGARDEPLVGEELLLRARLDLDRSRLAHAAIELKGAYATLLPALAAEGRRDLAARLRELEGLAGGVEAAAHAAVQSAGGGSEGAAVNEATVGHALARLEAAMRARAASGFAAPPP